MLSFALLLEGTAPFLENPSVYHLGLLRLSPSGDVLPNADPFEARTGAETNLMRKSLPNHLECAPEPIGFFSGEVFLQRLVRGVRWCATRLGQRLASGPSERLVQRSCEATRRHVLQVSPSGECTGGQKTAIPDFIPTGTAFAWVVSANAT